MPRAKVSASGHPSVQRLVIALTVLVAAASCGGASPTAPSRPAGVTFRDPFSADMPPSGGAYVFVGAGDIAMCDKNAEDTARILDNIPGTVFTLGDNAYFVGSAQEYRDCYHPTWGRHRARTRPVPGNHEYETAGAEPYFAYFGSRAGPAGLGYYSYDLGEWHIVALNSQVPAGAGSAQERWLREDLASSGARCTLAYWHYPLFTSGPNGRHLEMRDLWRTLQEAGAEVVMTGHEHFYERFAPQDDAGRPDPVRGMRAFVVGSGGALLYQPVMVAANSEVRLSTFGVLKLTLAPGRYDWEFLPVSGAGDTGSGQCH